MNKNWLNGLGVWKSGFNFWENPIVKKSNKENNLKVMRVQAEKLVMLCYYHCWKYYLESELLKLKGVFSSEVQNFKLGTFAQSSQVKYVYLDLAF